MSPALLHVSSCLFVSVLSYLATGRPVSVWPGMLAEAVTFVVFIWGGAHFESRPGHRLF